MPAVSSPFIGDVIGLENLETLLRYLFSTIDDISFDEINLNRMKKENVIYTNDGRGRQQGCRAIVAPFMMLRVARSLKK